MEIERFCNYSLSRKIAGSLSTSLVQPFHFVRKNKNYHASDLGCYSTVLFTTMQIALTALFIRQLPGISHEDGWTV